MNLLNVENLTKSYGGKLLFDRITFGMEKGRKTALIAKNGSGKTTLLNIIMGIDIPDEGNVTLRKDVQVAYLPQVNDSILDGSVIDMVLDSNTPLIAAIKNYEKLLGSYHHSDLGKEEKAAMEKSLEDMERLNAWNYESRIKEVLYRFNIKDLFVNIGELSGGERRKLALAKTLLSDADLWILDEPTNHLDLDMIEWLENFLTTANKTLLLVTHDRFFLDRVCDDIIEIDQGKLYKYKGKYSYFLEKKAERLSIQAAEQEKYLNLYRRESAWIHASVQARSTKAKARKEHFWEIKEKAFAEKVDEESAFSVQSERLGKKILEINNLDFSYPDKPILKDFSYVFKKNEHCGIVGANGCGKTTFLRLIMGEMQADAGKISVGETIVFGYYNQDGIVSLNSGKRVIDIVREKAEIVKMADGHECSASHFLNHFGFTHDMQYTYFEDLSGGQKRKLHLLLVLMKNPNFLILDEPTNDFDIDTMNLLEDFLLDFKGCLLVVSHDRWFMDKIAEHLFVFQGEGKIKDFYGNYSEYKKYCQKLEKGRQLKTKMDKTEQPKLCCKSPRSENKMTYKECKEMEILELEIEDLEKEKKNLYEKFSNPSGDTKELSEMSERYKIVQLELDEKSMRWLELSEKK